MPENINYKFCTLFDRGYIFRGLALHDSIVRFCPDFELWILCLDDDCYGMLEKMNLKNVHLVHLKEIESEELLKAKNNRKHSEYCWTLGSFFTNFVISNNNIDHITYLDSDIYFFSSPKPLYEELGDSSVLIISHNYEKKLKYLEKKSGKYNVAFVVFKNNECGLRVLRDWTGKCLDWCYNKYEEGRFGDQKYLDYWEDDYDCIKVSQKIGADVAPWNVSSFDVSEINGKVLVDNEDLIFYHLHTFKIINKDKFQPASSFYFFSSKAVNFIYDKYMKNLSDIIDRIEKVDVNFKYGFNNQEKLKDKVKNKIKRMLMFLLYVIKKI
jgi:hypothetical protein